MAISWNETNLNTLKTHFDRGDSLESIAAHLGTTRRAVQVKLNRTGVRFHASRSYMMRVCSGCGKEDRITFTQAKESKFCSRECWDKNRPTGPRKRKTSIRGNCLQCSKEIRKKARYCNNTCLSLHRNSTLLSRWLAGESALARAENGYVRTFARNYLIQSSKNECSRCGWNEVNPVTGKVPLTVDHTDGNSDNTHPSNLKVLCPNCHSLTPTYGGLNKGNGRKKRRERRISTQI